MEKSDTTPTGTEEQVTVSQTPSKDIADRQNGVRESVWPPQHLSPPNIISFDDVGGRSGVMVERPSEYSGPQIDFNHRIVVEARPRELH